jgi:hypothetical protein
MCRARPPGGRSRRPSSALSHDRRRRPTNLYSAMDRVYAGGMRAHRVRSARVPRQLLSDRREPDESHAHRRDRDLRSGPAPHGRRRHRHRTHPRLRRLPASSHSAVPQVLESCRSTATRHGSTTSTSTSTTTCGTRACRGPATSAS